MKLKQTSVRFLSLALLWCMSGPAQGLTLSTNYYDNFSGVPADESIQAGGTYSAPSAATGWDYYGTEGAGTSASQNNLWNYCNLDHAGGIVQTTATAIALSAYDITFSAELKKAQTSYEEAVLLVQMNGAQWYAWDRNDEIGTSLTNITWQFDPDPFHWKEVTLARETSPVLGAAPTVELTGEVTGFGLLHDRRSGRAANTLNMGSFTVETAPVIYREHFVTNSATAMPTKGWDWMSGGAGSGGVGVNGYLWKSLAWDDGQYGHVYTEAQTIDPNLYEWITFTAWIGDGGGNDFTVFLTVKVDGQWYIRSTAGQSANSLEFKAYSLDYDPAATWSKMTVSGSGQAASVGWGAGGSHPPAGSPIQGFGYFMGQQNATRTLQLDSVTVTGQRKPGTLFYFH